MVTYRSRCWAVATLVLLAGAWPARVADAKPQAAGGAEPRSADKGKSVLDAAGLAGGLVVHLDCGDGGLTAAIGRAGRVTVRGLGRQEQTVAAARKRIAGEGLYGRVSVGLWDGNVLPFRDNLVNLIVAEGPLGAAEADAMRALAPRGVLLVRQGDGWDKRVKPWPDDIDEWTHFLHGPDNNAVARDRVVGPPQRLQWLADPVHLRSHEHLNSISALVSARGRIFTVLDEGPVAAVTAPPKWRLVARDAFNGLLLWKRDLGPWEGHWRLFRSGPPETTRRLVAVGDKVYVTLGYNKPVAALDAATGKTVRVYDETKGALEILCGKGRLYVLAGEIDLTPPADAARPWTATPAPRKKGVLALDADTGQVLWTRKDKDTDEIMPTTLAVAGGGVFFQNTRQVLCLDAGTGKEKWRADRPVYTSRLSWSAPTLVVRDGVVLSADGSTGGMQARAARGGDKTQWIVSDRDIRKHPMGDLIAFSAESGRKLWVGSSLQGFCSPGDLFVIDGLVWAGANVAAGQAELKVAVDLKTGQAKLPRPYKKFPVGGHARCYRDKATERYLVLGGSGVEFVDVKDWSLQANPWVRGTCQYGVMPCNGLLYSPPDSCACRPEMRVHGFAALAPKAPAHKTNPPKAPPQLTRGPAYAAIENRPSSIVNPDPWPTYRHDAARSGRASSAVPAKLDVAWSTRLDGNLTSVTVGADKVFVADVDSDTVYALHTASGRVIWKRTVGGAVDSPPTIHAGRVLFGCRDGCVYSLRAADGELAWRFRAGPCDRSLIAMERVESVWPVHGSVLVRDGLVWFVAGRSSYLDGGIRLYALDAATGRPRVSRRLNARGDDGFRTGQPTDIPRPPADQTPPMLPDILSASEGLVYMRWLGFDKDGNVARSPRQHLFSATGFLDGTWWHRTYWQWGTWMRGGFGGWPQAGRVRPAGRIMAIADDAIFGFGRSQYDPGNPRDVHAGHVGVVKNGYQDEGRIDYSRNVHRLYCADKPPPAKAVRRGAGPVKYRWQRPIDVLARGMVLAGDTLFLAGPPAGKANHGLAELPTVQPGLLRAVRAADGKTLAELDLPAACVLDGVAAGRECLVIACEDGFVRCLRAAEK